MKTQKGFTLVEILIVVVILGILAAIVIPQFTDASAQANESRMNTDLQTLRSQIELYKIQHNSLVPDVANFAACLTSKTLVTGVINASGDYGPYMQAIPTNPYNELNTIRIDNSDTGNLATHGWRFDTSTGFIHSDVNSPS